MMVETANVILDGLDAEEASALQAVAREVPLERGAVIADAGEPSPYL